MIAKIKKSLQLKVRNSNVVFYCTTMLTFIFGTLTICLLLLCTQSGQCEIMDSSNIILNRIHNLERKKIIIDTDIGSDDAVAILTALQFMKKTNDIEIIAFTCVFGNTHLEHVKINILKTLKIANALDIPVYAGADRSIITTPNSDFYYGNDGLGDFDFPDPPSIDLIQNEHAVTALIRLINEDPGNITIVAIGPLTNIALAIRMDPTFRDNIKQLTILGGSVNGYGNMPPTLEFNFYMDPEAVFIVFNSSKTICQSPLIILPWDTMVKHAKIPIEWRRKQLGTIKNDRIDFLNKAERVDTTNNTVWWASDGLLMATVLNPKLALQAEAHYILPAIQGEFRGGLIVDRNNILQQNKNVIVITDVDTESFKQFLIEQLK